MNLDPFCDSYSPPSLTLASSVSSSLESKSKKSKQAFRRLQRAAKILATRTTFLGLGHKVVWVGVVSMDESLFHSEDKYLKLQSVRAA